MAAKVIAAVFLVVFTIFLLSVFGPMHSQKKFWLAIRRLRDIMDFGSYWFYNLCGIATILYIVLMIVRSVLRNYI